jgi:hypothetical protein
MCSNKEICKNGYLYVLWSVGLSWHTGLSTTLICLAVPYLRLILRASYVHIIWFFLGESCFRIAGYSLSRIYVLAKSQPLAPCTRMILVIFCLVTAVGSSMGFSTIPLWLNVKDDSLRPTIISMATLFYGLTRFSIELGLRLNRKLEGTARYELELKTLEKLSLVGLALGFLEALLLFWIPTNLLDNLPLIVGLAGGVALIQMILMFVAWRLRWSKVELYQPKVMLRYEYSFCPEMASRIRTIWTHLDVMVGIASLLFLVFRMVSYSILIFAIDWYAQHESNSPALSTNFYDINGAFTGLARVLLVPIVFFLVFPFVKNAISNYIHEDTFSWYVYTLSWLISLLCIGTFLSLFLCFLYFQQSLFDFAFLSIGLIISLFPLKQDLIEYFVGRSSDLFGKDHGVEARDTYRRLFELLDLMGTLLGSVISSIILECYGYAILLPVVAFSMGFVFVALCSLSLFKLRESCNKTSSLVYQVKKHSFRNGHRGDTEYRARPYLNGIGAEPKVIFKRTVPKFV